MALNSSTLRNTSDFLASISKKDVFKPSDLEFIYYLLAKEFSLSLVDVDRLPIPYLMGLVSTYNYVKEEELKAHKKAQRK